MKHYNICFKNAYGSEEEAKKELKRIRKTSGSPDWNKKKRPVRAYKCNVCYCWHLTSKPAKKAS